MHEETRKVLTDLEKRVLEAEKASHELGKRVAALRWRNPAAERPPIGLAVLCWDIEGYFLGSHDGKLWTYYGRFGSLLPSCTTKSPPQFWFPLPNPPEKETPP